MADAPDNSSYLLISSDPLLANNRQIASVAGIDLIDTGPNGQLVIAPGDTLLALQSLTDLGFLTQTANGELAARSVTTDGSLAIANPQGVAGNINLSVVDNTSSQNFNVFFQGSLVANTGSLTFIQGAGIGMNVTSTGTTVEVEVLSSGGAISDGTYIVQTPDASLPQAQALSSLSPGGILKCNSGGVVSIAQAGTDYQAASPNLTALAGLSPGLGSMIVGTGSTWTARSIGTNGQVPVSNGTDWAWGAAGGGGGAPSTATYITQIPNAGLTSEQALSLLTPGGLMKCDSGGVVSIAQPGTDYFEPGPTFALNLTGSPLLPQLVMASSTAPSSGSLPLHGGAISVTNGVLNFTNNEGAGFNGTILTSGSVIPISGGGTGQVTKTPAFDALQPMTTLGDIIVGGASGTGTRLPLGALNTVLTSNGTTAVWQAGGGGFVNPMTTEGDLIVGGTAGAPQRLGIGSNANYALISNGTNAASWQKIAGQALTFALGGGTYDGPTGSTTVYSWEITSSIVPFLNDPTVFSNFMVNIPIAGIVAGAATPFGLACTINGSPEIYTQGQLDFVGGNGAIGGITFAGPVSAIAFAGISTSDRFRLWFTSSTAAYTNQTTPDTIIFTLFPGGAF